MCNFVTRCWEATLVLHVHGNKPIHIDSRAVTKQISAYYQEKCEEFALAIIGMLLHVACL